MSAADGKVLGVSKIHNSGPAQDKWNLVVMGDGYVSSRLSQFRNDAEELRQFLFSQNPFNDPAIASKINIFRIDIESDEGGADDPKCSDPSIPGGGGNGKFVRTMLDSTYCFDGVTHRLLYGDAAHAQRIAEMNVKDWAAILVIVDDPGYGGAGGAIGWFSNGAHDWKQVALHELGHAAFDLADEYDYGPSMGPPIEANVSDDPDPATVKWSHLVTVPTPRAVPTQANPDCSQTNPNPPQSAMAIGTYEGAKYEHCGIYRPRWNCLMRRLDSDFCPVCEEAIRGFYSKV